MRAKYKVLSEGLNLPWCGPPLPAPDQALFDPYQCDRLLTRPQMRATRKPKVWEMYPERMRRLVYSIPHMRAGWDYMGRLTAVDP